MSLNRNCNKRSDLRRLLMWILFYKFYLKVIWVSANNRDNGYTRRYLSEGQAVFV